MKRDQPVLLRPNTSGDTDALVQALAQLALSVAARHVSAPARKEAA